VIPGIAGFFPPGQVGPFDMRENLCDSRIVVRETFCSSLRGDRLLFEALAFLSTVAFISIFVVLLQMDRAARKERGDDGPRA
jgi:hypothetical protein